MFGVQRKTATQIPANRKNMSSARSDIRNAKPAIVLSRSQLAAMGYSKESIDRIQKADMYIQQYSTDHTSSRINCYWLMDQMRIQLGLSDAEFIKRTHFSDDVFTSIKKHHKAAPEVKTIVTFCAGLDYGMDTACILARNAPRIFPDGSTEHDIYEGILTVFNHYTFDEKNGILLSYGFTELGSK